MASFEENGNDSKEGMGFKYGNICWLVKASAITLKRRYQQYELSRIRNSLSNN